MMLDISFPPDMADEIMVKGLRQTQRNVQKEVDRFERGCGGFAEDYRENIKFLEAVDTVLAYYTVLGSKQ